MINRAINTVLQSELVSKVLQHEAVLETILKAVTSSLEARDALSARYESLLSSTGLVTLSQHQTLREELERLTQEAEGLNEQMSMAGRTARTLRKRAESAEAQVVELTALLESARADLSAFKAAESLSATLGDHPEPVDSDHQSSPSGEAQPSDGATDTAPLWRMNMTKAELIKAAAAVGLELSAKLKKSELIERIRESTPSP